MPGLLLHSVATRAAQTAAEISAEFDVPAREVIGIHEVQVGDLENRNDQEAVDEFDATYRRWLHGERDVSMPGGESANDVLERYLPVLDELRVRYLDDENWTSDIVVVSHGAAIRLTGAVLGDVDSSFALEHHLANTEAVVLTARGRRAVELRAVGHPDAAVRVGAGQTSRPNRSPTRWAELRSPIDAGASLLAQSHPTASQSSTNA